MPTIRRFHPVPPADARTGFGFDAIMRRAEHGRFERWYAAMSRLIGAAPGR